MEQAILVGLVALFGYLEVVFGNSMIQRPIVMGPLVGLVLGDFKTGLEVGASLELAFMGSVAIGAALPPEITAGGLLGTAFAISTGNGTEAALALSLPIATISLLITNAFFLTIRAYLLHKSDSYAVNGNVKGVNRMHIISSLSWPIFMAVLMAGSFYVGGPTVQAIFEMIPDFVNDVLSVATGILPALGFALLASMLINKKVAPFFLLGFVLSAYLEMPILGITLIGIIIVMLMITQERTKENIVIEGDIDDDF